MEDQMAQRQSDLTSAERNPEFKRKIAVAKAEVERERQSLSLQRERILSERTASPYRRAALVSALTDVELKLETLACAAV